jgi:hypothetical protein
MAILKGLKVPEPEHRALAFVVLGLVYLETFATL